MEYIWVLIVVAGVLFAAVGLDELFRWMERSEQKKSEARVDHPCHVVDCQNPECPEWGHCNGECDDIFAQQMTDPDGFDLYSRVTDDPNPSPYIKREYKNWGEE